MIELIKRKLGGEIDYSGVPPTRPPWGLNISARLGLGGLTPEKFV